MTIPKNINRTHIIEAINRILIEGVPEIREATKYELAFNNSTYPPKYVISLANKYANGDTLPSSEFSGGEEANEFLKSRGFLVQEKKQNQNSSASGNLEIQFHRDMLSIYENAKKIGYNASRFIQMVANQGGLNVAKKFINSINPSDGFTKLVLLKRWDLTVEALVLKNEYHSLFSNQEREIAKSRLIAHGYDVPYDKNTNTWIFQGNPRDFDIDNYVKDHEFIWWSLRQEHFADEIQINDEVFLWRSDGGKRGTGGILAKCKIVSLPLERADDSSSNEYWRTDDWRNSYLAVKLEVLDVKLEVGFIFRLSLLEHPILNDLMILRQRQQTNYLLSREHSQEINRLWSLNNIKEELEKDIDSELAEEDEYYTDGTVKEFYGKRYERNPENRKKAIEIHGLSCLVCDFNFEEVYGERGKDFIEVHHVKPLSTIKERIVISPATDLVPVCSNCHRMIHRKKDEVLSIEELKEILNLI